MQKELPVDPNDPLDVALSHRKQAGSVDTQISGLEAKKKKIQIPQPLNLAVKAPKDNLLVFCTDEMIK